MSLKFIEKLVAPVHKSTLIWMHGLGDSGHGHLPFADDLKFSEDLGVKFIFPHAPSRPVTINGGMVMPSWYDILGMGDRRSLNEEELEQSAEQISSLIQKEVESGISSENIILVGFSQGGCVALHTALKYPVKLGGIACLSTYLGVDSSLHTSTSHVNKDIPIFWGHGILDQIVTKPLTDNSIKCLEEHHYKIEFHNYEIDHWIHPQELIDLQAWISKILLN